MHNPKRSKLPGLEHSTLVEHYSLSILSPTHTSKRSKIFSLNDRAHNNTFGWSFRGNNWRLAQLWAYWSLSCMVFRKEAWLNCGQRMRKSLRGYAMLSNRGFADTARFYPNMNQQRLQNSLMDRSYFLEQRFQQTTICKLRYVRRCIRTRNRYEWA